MSLPTVASNRPYTVKRLYVIVFDHDQRKSGNTLPRMRLTPTPWPACPESGRSTIGMPQYSGTLPPNGDCAPGSFVTQRFLVMPSRQLLPAPTHTTYPLSLI